MGKSKLEFFAKITTSDGREIIKRVEEEIPDDQQLTIAVCPSALVCVKMEEEDMTLP